MLHDLIVNPFYVPVRGAARCVLRWRCGGSLGRGRNVGTLLDGTMLGLRCWDTGHGTSRERVISFRQLPHSGNMVKHIVQKKRVFAWLLHLLQKLVIHHDSSKAIKHHLRPWTSNATRSFEVQCFPMLPPVQSSWSFMSSWSCQKSRDGPTVVQCSKRCYEDFCRQSRTGVEAQSTCSTRNLDQTFGTDGKSHKQLVGKLVYLGVNWISFSEERGFHESSESPDPLDAVVRHSD